MIELKITVENAISILIVNIIQAIVIALLPLFGAKTYNFID